MPSCDTYHLIWVSLTLDERYLLTTAPSDGGQIRELCHSVVIDGYCDISTLKFLGKKCYRNWATKIFQYVVFK